MTCEAPTKSGKPCRAPPPPGAKLCAIHDPDKSGAMRAGRSAGGKSATARPGADGPPKPMSLTSKEDVLELAKDTINRIRAEQMNPKQGSAIGVLLNVALGVMKARDEDKADDGGERPLAEETVAKLEETYRAIQANH